MKIKDFLGLGGVVQLLFSQFETRLDRRQGQEMGGNRLTSCTGSKKKANI